MFFCDCFLDLFFQFVFIPQIIDKAMGSFTAFVPCSAFPKKKKDGDGLVPRQIFDFPISSTNQKAYCNLSVMFVSFVAQSRYDPSIARLCRSTNLGQRANRKNKLLTF